MKQVYAMVICSIVLFTFSAEAQRNQRREGRQQARIAEGVKSGELTAHEARKLNRGQRRVDRAQTKAMADGTFSSEEQRQLEKQQDIQSKRIYKEKHDDQERGN